MSGDVQDFDGKTVLLIESLDVVAVFVQHVSLLIIYGSRSDVLSIFPWDLRKFHSLLISSSWEGCGGRVERVLFFVFRRESRLRKCNLD